MALDEQAFRNRARELARSQVALLLTEFQGFAGSGSCFENFAVNALRDDLARTLRTFIEHTPIEPAHPEAAGLMEGLQHSTEIRTDKVNAERARLEKAGL